MIYRSKSSSSSPPTLPVGMATSSSSLPLMKTKPSQKRLVSKDGRSLMRSPASGIRETWISAFKDMWGAWLSLRWRWVVLAFCGSFLLHWLLFAILWYVLARANGDLVVDHDNPPPGHTLCVKYVTGFTAAFSFALETQLTIGYGTMYPNADCPMAIALLALQMLLGLMLEAFITGAFVAKFSRPQKRCSGILFSPKAVVCEVEGQRCLMFRVCNLLSRPLVDVCVSSVLYEEQDDHTIHQTALDFMLDGLGSRPCPLFLSPLTFLHPLTPDSPLNRVMPPSGQSQFELVVFLSASQEGTGSAYHKRTSYLADEIQYGRRFTKAVLHGERRNSAQAMRYFDTHICSLMGPNTYSNSRDKECVVQVNGDGNDAME
ncbi:hypothetical protein HF521_002678 [Silurus meridionalis]|uniref:Inward rectifier potassium channel 13 n=3 Tax=Silurus TaxID=94992 RepID=A0A8T0B0Q8_SILME|nr:hypothetical protein HF521_002678 [Silurus meridionalis]